MPSRSPRGPLRERAGRARDSGSLSRRRFLQAALLFSGGALLPAAGAGPGPASGPCADTIQQILDAAATLEALALTFYYRAITTPGGFFERILSPDRQGYLRATLAAERSHYHWLAIQGAQPLAGAFYFAPNTFGALDLPTFSAAQDAIETTQIALYLAAARRFGEEARPDLAEIAGQILGVESEHRVIGREISAAPPNPRNDRCFEQATAGCVAEALGQLGPFLYGGGGFSGPFAQPSNAAIDMALAGVSCTDVPPAAAAACSETAAQILDIAAAAEALGITLYYHGTQGGFFAALEEQQQWYLQAALDEERSHLDFLKANGGAPPAAPFFFPAGMFDDLAAFLDTLDMLENLFIGAYLAAMRRFAQLGQPLLSEIAGQILGVEAEHRVLGRIIGGARPPNDLCLERASYSCLSEAAGALAPFIQGDQSHTLQKAQPTPEQIDTAVSLFGCTPVPLATNPPYRVYGPIIRR
jgi:hypothetical protein